MTTTYTLADLATRVEGTLRGPGDVVIRSVAALAGAQPDQAAWLSRSKYAGALGGSNAGVVLVPADFGDTPCPAILCPHIDRSVALLLEAFAPAISAPPAGVHTSAVVDAHAHVDPTAAVGPGVVIAAGARIGAGTVLHAQVYVGADSTIGEGCVLWPGVVVRERCQLGDRVIVHPNAVIGSDGFGFYFHEGRHHKVPHTGGVRIGDDVEIGACTCIDRSKFGHTVVGPGTKIDNQVQIAHNGQVGAHCILAGQAGLAGSVVLGDYVVLGGRAAVLDGLTVGPGAKLAGGVAIAAKDVAAGAVISGFPGRDHREHLQELASLRRLPALLAELKQLRARIEQLEAAADHSA